MEGYDKNWVFCKNKNARLRSHNLHVSLQKKIEQNFYNQNKGYMANYCKSQYFCKVFNANL